MYARLMLAAAFGLALADSLSAQPKKLPDLPPPPMDPPPTAVAQQVPPPPVTAPAPDPRALPALPALPDGTQMTPVVGPRIWFSADYLLWWTKGQRLAEPLITVGSSNDPIPGALGQPNTQVLFGDERIGYDVRSGLKLGLGGWIDDNGIFGWEAYGFFLARKSRGVSYGSDGSGVEALGQPTIDPVAGEAAYSTSLQGLIAGNIWASTSSSLRGWEVNSLLNLVRSDRVEYSLIVGYRQLTLRESLRIESDIYGLQDCDLSFCGVNIDPGDHLITRDCFKAINTFYGAQIGNKLSWSGGRFGVDLVGKVGIGVTQEQVRVYGDTTWLPAGGNPQTALGGILAQETNIGHYYRPKFAVLPEVNLNAWYDINAWARVGVGYTFLYLSSVVRPGQVIDRTVDPGRVPSDQLFGKGTTTDRPGINFHETGFWAQGLNFTLNIRY